MNVPLSTRDEALSALRNALARRRGALDRELRCALDSSPLSKAVRESGALEWLDTHLRGGEDAVTLARAAQAMARDRRARGTGVDVLVEAARVWSRAAQRAVRADDVGWALDEVLFAVVGAWATTYATATTGGPAPGDILQRVIDHIPYGIAIYSPADLTLQQINRFGREFLAEPYHEEPAIGLPMETVLPRAAQHGLAQAVRRVAETREPLVIREAPLESHDHTTYCNWIVLPISDDSGRVMALVHVIDDVTQDVESRRRLERFAHETELRRAELEAVIASIADGVLILDRTGYLLQANEAATRILGMDEDALREALLNPRAWRLWDVQGNRVRPREISVARALRTGETVVEEELTVRVGRREAVVSVSAAPIHDPDGTVSRVVAVMRDVTRQRQAYEERVRLERLRAVGEMASGIAHDFNNLLSLVLGRTELLLNEVRRGRANPSALVEALQTIEQAAMDGAETVRRLQEFTRSQHAGSPQGAVDVNEVIRDAVALTRPRWRDAAQQEGRTIECVVRAGEAVPLAQGSASDLREVLINLIFNAVDAMPGGGTLTLSSTCADGWVRVAVADTGVGMTRDVKRRIFEPFFTTKGPGGGGMGLSMAYGIVNRWGGKIEVESARGRGSTFTILLPPAAGLPAAPEADAGSSPQARILAVDDEPGILETLQLILSADGHEVTVCRSGPEAIERAAIERYDLVFTDLGMPEMSGWEVARRVKEILPKTPVALVTGWGVSLDHDRLRESGVDLVISKPFRMADLRQVVAEALMLRDKM